MVRFFARSLRAGIGMGALVLAACGDSASDDSSSGGASSGTSSGSGSETTVTGATSGGNPAASGAGGDASGTGSGGEATTVGSGGGGEGGGAPVISGCAARVAEDGDVFVRPDAADDAERGVEFDGDGSSWAAASADGAPGARRGLPTSGLNQNLLSSDLARGSTYYLAAGSYAGVAFDDEDEGETPIRVYKATAENAGHVAGWDAAFGGQATFRDYLAFATGYYEFDGQTRDESEWDDDASYGFRVDAVLAHWDNFPPGGHFIRLACVSIGGTPGAGYSPSMGDGVGLAGGDEMVHDWTISHAYLHETRTAVHMSGFRGATIEHSFIGPSWSKEAIIGIYTGYDVTVRNNVFVDNCQDVPDDPTAQGCTAEIAAFNSQGGGNYDDWHIYGNVFASRTTRGIAHSDGVILGGSGPSTANGWRVYNNVITRLDSTEGLKNVAIHLQGEDNHVYNNVWFDIGAGSAIGCDAGSCENNGCFTASSAECGDLGVGGIVGDVDPFVDAEGGDYRLAEGSWAIDAGKTLDEGFDDVDPAGHTRGVDGAWDLGAFER